MAPPPPPQNVTAPAGSAQRYGTWSRPAAGKSPQQTSEEIKLLEEREASACLLDTVRIATRADDCAKPKAGVFEQQNLLSLPWKPQVQSDLLGTARFEVRQVCSSVKGPSLFFQPRPWPCPHPCPPCSMGTPLPALLHGHIAVPVSGSPQIAFLLLPLASN